jgi:hypothetical protein
VVPDNAGGDNEINCANVGGKWNVFTPPVNSVDVTAGEDAYDTTAPSSSSLTCQSLSGLQVSNGAAAFLNTMDQVDHPIHFLEGTVGAAMMTADFVTGQGPQLRQFGPESIQSRQLAQSQGVRQAVTDIVNGLQPTGYTFGGGGLLAAGLNPTQQFVGSFSVASTHRNGNTLSLFLYNETSVWSGAYHQLPSHDRASFPAGGTTAQIYQVNIPCP